MQKVFALQRIYQEGMTEKLLLPPDPRTWVRPKVGATSVEIIGVDSLSEEFIVSALMHGWRYVGGRFYPTLTEDEE